METLTAPSREVALQILQEVGFEDRLIGSYPSCACRIRILSLYSLEEVFLLLKEPYPQIDLDQLESWIRTVIKDGELADRIKTVIGQKCSRSGYITPDKGPCGVEVDPVQATG